MKRCPVCNAMTFDDATTCFGCLHRFEAQATQEVQQEGRHGKAAIRGVIPGGQEVFASALRGTSQVTQKDGAAEMGNTTGPAGMLGAAFVISVLPRRTPDGAVAWYCNVAAQQPQRVQPTYA